MWELDFTCPPCMVDSLISLPEVTASDGAPYLLQLSYAMLRSHSARLAMSTWKNYIRCVDRSVSFMQDTGIVCFPVLNERSARGAMLFFQYLKGEGLAWASLKSFRSAWKSFHQALGLPDPWVAYPGLAMLTAGLQRQVSTPPLPKVGLTIVMIKELVRYVHHHEPLFRKAGNHNVADVLLRDLVAVLLGFFAMRRSDELFVNKAHTHGILMRHVVLIPSSHLSLWVQGQKTDQLGQGHAVTLAWVTGSGIQLGWWVQRLLERLKQCDISYPSSPLFLPTIGNQGFRRVPVGQVVGKPMTFQRLFPKVFPVFERFPAMLKLFNWHSCRRGGATHGYWSEVSTQLLAPHGGWHSEAGLKGYTSASFSQRLSVTLRM